MRAALAPPPMVTVSALMEALDKLASSTGGYSGDDGASLGEELIDELWSLAGQDTWIPLVDGGWLPVRCWVFQCSL